MKMLLQEKQGWQTPVISKNQFSPRLRACFTLATRGMIGGLVLLLAGCANNSEQSPPSVTLAAGAGSSASTKTWKTGELTSPPFEIKAECPTTKLSGTWDGVRGTVTVYLASPSKIQKAASAYHAADGYAAGKLVGDDPFATTYMFARFERKSFPWGQAVSFLTLSTQLREYSPHNDGLRYEIWGVTRDGHHIVHASFNTAHPKLPATWAQAREAASTDALKNDPDYALIERCPAQDFQPSLASIDRILDSIRIEAHKTP